MLRMLQWAEKRVFFMTPQTFLNDLRTETCDPTDVVLLVIGISASPLSPTWSHWGS
jgi:ERCC4-related helicase